MTDPPTHLDRFLPRWDMRARHERAMRAEPGRAYDAARTLDLGRSVPVAALLAIRRLPVLLINRELPPTSLTLDRMLDLGFVILEEDAGVEIVLGAIGKFWRLDSGIVPVAAGDFVDFAEPGYAKAALNFLVAERGEGRVVVSTETRVACTDENARRAFLRYWKVIAPFSGFTRGEMLRAIERTVERGADRSAVGS